MVVRNVKFTILWIVTSKFPHLSALTNLVVQSQTRENAV
jgi:hypothetical protein